MYPNLQDFLDDWQSESKLTLRLFDKINEGEKSIKLNDKVRSLERMAWHITQTLTEMPFRAGIFESDILENKPIPSSIRELSDMYSKYSDQLMALLKEKWIDADLNEAIEVYGERWERGKILSILVKHQIHHRGQMTAIMRMLDMEVPGLYGPSREEWSQFGMSPQE